MPKTSGKSKKPRRKAPVRRKVAKRRRRMTRAVRPAADRKRTGRSAGLAAAVPEAVGPAGPGTVSAAEADPAEIAGEQPGPVVSVVIPVRNERKTIAKVVREALRVHPRTEVIVVVNGSTDGSAAAARSAGADVLEFAEPLGHDVGRAVGGRAAKGEVVLFTDGDMVIPAADLRRFVQAVVRDGADIALNSYNGPIFREVPHQVVLAKYALNDMLDRTDLRGASLTAVPHALSRRALETVGPDMLAVPPLAQAIAVRRGLDVRTAGFVNVGRLNPLRGAEAARLLQALILGDHLEAAAWVASDSGGRAAFQDVMRQRGRVI